MTKPKTKPTDEMTDAEKKVKMLLTYVVFDIQLMLHMQCMQIVKAIQEDLLPWDMVAS